MQSLLFLLLLEFFLIRQDSGVLWMESSQEAVKCLLCLFAIVWGLLSLLLQLLGIFSNRRVVAPKYDRDVAKMFLSLGLPCLGTSIATLCGCLDGSVFGTCVYVIMEPLASIIDSRSLCRWIRCSGWPLRLLPGPSV